MDFNNIKIEALKRAQQNEICEEWAIKMENAQTLDELLYYRIEKLDGTKIEGGTLSTVSDSGIGRKFTITEDVYFYHLIYFKNTTSGSTTSIPSLETYQIELGSSPTSFEPYNILESINGLPIVGDDLTNVTNRYFKKRFLTAGDSITAGTEGGYIKYISDILGCEITNVASSGSRTGRFVGILTDIKDRSDTPLNGVLAPDYNLYEGGIFMIGTNSDSAIGYGSLTDIPTGTVLDYPGNELDYFNSFPNTYYANVALVIEWIKWKNAKFVINLVSPPFTAASNSKDISNRLKELANYYSVNFIDGTHQSGLALKQRSVYTYDGTHFNTLGNEIWGKFLASKLS